MGPGDQAILVTHQPRWLSDWFWDETACHNLRQLVRGHLRGRARVHLAGQLHHHPASVHLVDDGFWLACKVAVWARSHSDVRKAWPQCGRMSWNLSTCKIAVMIWN